ncbi:hypothetical protein CMT41_14680 [Colwellia sp. MT41]|uniref:putative porin n=1 Tax=Colwellia sp. MT41 TaxID=58049 RepID=UPI0007179A1F|nr:putative porin [Colwellia sp. MT41]ALO35826.1 hypothetical protein CMT41_14680 [Colwellia sp. MT41]
MKVSKLSALVALLLSNTVLAESYQSFSTVSYSHSRYTSNMPAYDLYSKSDTDAVALYSKYYFDERQTLGPLNEFAYINTISNLYVLVANSNTEVSSAYKSRDSNSDSSDNSIAIGGQWIINNFIFGVNYSYYKSEGKWTDSYFSDGNEISYDNSSSYYAAEIGYLISDDLVISAHYNDGGDGDDYFSYSSSYNWQLSGMDYIGFSYNVDEDFDVHQLSSKYFFGIAEQSYIVLGGGYTLDNRDVVFVDDYWSVNASYYYNDSTSVSVTYSDNDFYSLGASYFISNNYSVQLGYNSVANNKDENDFDGYYLSFSAQF